MNPLAESVGSADHPPLPPMGEVRKTLKVDWYRCPIDKEVLRELSKPDDAKGYFQALGHLGLWCFTGITAFIFFQLGWWVAFFATVFLHGTIGSFLTAPHHELCHKTVFKTRPLNDFFLKIFSTIGWLNFPVYRFSHNYHHRFTLHPEGDREEIMPVQPSLRALYILQLLTLNITGGYQSRGIIPTLGNTLKLAKGDTSRPFNSWGPELYEGFEAERLKAVNWSRWLVAFHAGIALFAIVIGQPVIILLVSGSVFIANWLRYFVGVPMHCGLKSNNNDFRKCARSITLDPFSEFLYWHMNWHLEHHMYAGVPCYNLNKLHNAVADHMPEPRTLLGAWQEMLATWKRQKEDPDYAFDTPVPSPAVVNESNPSNDPVAASVGGLEPEALTNS